MLFVVLVGDLLHVIEVVFVIGFAEKFVGALHRLFRRSGKFFEVNEEHPVSEPFFQDFLDAFIGAADDVAGIHPRFATSFDGLEFEVISEFLGKLAGGDVFAPETFERGDAIADIAHADQRLDFAPQHGLGKIELAHPATGFIEDDRRGNLGIVMIIIHHAAQDVQERDFVGRRLKFGILRPMATHQLQHIQDSARGRRMESRVLRQQIAEQR